MSSSPNSTSIDDLRTSWTALYRTTLPFLAKSRAPSRSKWPVTLDHCFARIILDNTIGKAAGSDGEDLQWDKVIAKPAVRNMTERQLRGAIELGERIERGEVDLVELDEWSLGVRGKSKGKGRKRQEREEDGEEENVEFGKKKKRKVMRDCEDKEETGDDTKQARQKDKGRKPGGKKQIQSMLSFQNTDPVQLPSPTSSETATNHPGKTISIYKNISDISNDPTLTPNTILSTLSLIQSHPRLTPFRKRLYTSLFSVPTGQHTTYAALATHLGSIPRAVGNGMRNNPFAPIVPCHRVLASDGTLGGFFGDWGVDGKHGNEKIGLLHGEGVTFGTGGKVKGMVWSGFWDLADFEREFGEVNLVK